MSYIKTNWKNRVVEKPRTFTIQNNPDGTITLIPAEGVIYEEGTPITAANMNNIENGLEQAYAQMADLVPKTDFNEHTGDKSNPHGVTKSQVGLGSVLNYGIATKAEAEAGASNTKYMTPLRTKEALIGLSSELTVCGFYTGDNAATRIINLGFTPRGLILYTSPQYGLAEAGGKYRHSAIAVTGQAALIDTDIIVEIVSNGFKVYQDGTVRANQTGYNYNYIAIR